MSQRAVIGVVRFGRIDVRVTIGDSRSGCYLNNSACPRSEKRSSRIAGIAPIENVWPHQE